MKPFGPVRPTPAAPAAIPPLRSAVVLLVDDDADYRDLVRLAVEESDAAAGLPGGVEVHEVGHGEAALRFLRREGEFRDAPRPTLIYLDMEMPRMDGMATLAALKADGELRLIPTVMFTGVDDDRFVRRAAALGANSYAVKPGDVETLLGLINASTAYWLRVHRTARVRPAAVAEETAEAA